MCCIVEVHMGTARARRYYLLALAVAMCTSTRMFRLKQALLVQVLVFET